MWRTFIPGGERTTEQHVLPVNKKQKMIKRLIYSSYLFFLIFSLFSAHAFVQGSNEEEEELILRSDFPHGFHFGAGTSAYQIEGGYLEDGKGLNNWDAFCHIQGNIKNGETGDISNDHYHRYLEDIEIMHSLGLTAYRFSISWTRILPRGKFGEINPAGIVFYNKIIDELLLRGMEPFVTIHHHDLPQELEDRYGAWLSPLIQEDFVLLAEICFKSFGDRVKYWTTINEPNGFANLAYRDGQYPPGHCSPPFGNCSAGNSDVEPLIAMHNMLLGHAKAAKLYRDHFQPKQGGSIGVAASAKMFEPMRDDEIDDQDAVRRALIFYVAWNVDPLVFGDYPPEMSRYLGNELPQFTPEEANLIKGSMDFIGINHYTTLYAMDCIHSSCTQGGDRAIQGYAYTTGERDGVPIGERTGMEGFYVVPGGMEKMIEYFKKRYNNMPMFVFENGYASLQQKNTQVKDLLHDTKRVEFYESYLASVVRAIRNGADIRGYFVWNLMDDFEWQHGYDTKFGIVYVDRQTLNRIPKLSAKWYRDVITNRSLITNKDAATRSLYRNINVDVSESMDEKAAI